MSLNFTQAPRAREELWDLTGRLLAILGPRKGIIGSKPTVGRLWSTTHVDAVMADDDFDARRHWTPRAGPECVPFIRSGVTVRSLATAPWGARFASARSGVKPFPGVLLPPRDIESSGGFSGMASSGGFSGMDLGFSVWVSPTENWYFPPLGFCF